MLLGNESVKNVSATMNASTTTEELLDASFSTQSNVVSKESKLLVLPELLVVIVVLSAEKAYYSNSH
jgi:hypothetical protein